MSSPSSTSSSSPAQLHPIVTYNRTESPSPPSSLLPPSSLSPPIKVVSYNLLANQFFHTADRIYADPIRLSPSLRPAARVRRMKEELIALNADVICLQEVEMLKFDREWAQRIREGDEKYLAKQKEREANKKKGKGNQSEENAEGGSVEGHFDVSSSSEVFENRYTSDPSKVNAEELIAMEEEEKKEGDIGTFLRSKGYDIIVQHDLGRRPGHSVGTAIVYRTSTFTSLIWQESRSRALMCCLRLRHLNDDEKIDMGKYAANRNVYIACVHLQGHPLASQDRYSQMKSLLKEMSKKQCKDYGVNQLKYPKDPNILVKTIICGDFNSNQLSSVYSLLLNNNQSCVHVDPPKDGKVNNESTKLVRCFVDDETRVVIKTDGFIHDYDFNDAYVRSGYKPSFTYARPGQGWLIDFIFYTFNSLELFGVQKVFADKEEEEKIKASGLPTEEHVSDHLAIAASFVPK